MRLDTSTCVGIVPRLSRRPNDLERSVEVPMSSVLLDHANASEVMWVVLSVVWNR